MACLHSKDSKSAWKRLLDWRTTEFVKSKATNRVMWQLQKNVRIQNRFFRCMSPTSSDCSNRLFNKELVGDVSQRSTTRQKFKNRNDDGMMISSLLPTRSDGRCKDRSISLEWVPVIKAKKYLSPQPNCSPSDWKWNTLFLIYCAEVMCLMAWMSTVLVHDGQFVIRTCTRLPSCDPTCLHRGRNLNFQKQLSGDILSCIRNQMPP